MSKGINEIQPGLTCEAAVPITAGVAYAAAWGLNGVESTISETHWVHIAAGSRRQLTLKLAFNQTIESGWYSGCGDEDPDIIPAGPINFDGDYRQNQWPIQIEYTTGELAGNLYISLRSTHPGPYQLTLIEN